MQTKYKIIPVIAGNFTTKHSMAYSLVKQVWFINIFGFQFGESWEEIIASPDYDELEEIKIHLETNIPPRKLVVNTDGELVKEQTNDN